MARAVDRALKHLIHVIPDDFRARLCTCNELPNQWPTSMHVHNLEGPIAVRDGEWLIKDVAGDLHPISRRILFAIFERVTPLT